VKKDANAIFMRMKLKEYFTKEMGMKWWQEAQNGLRSH